MAVNEAAVSAVEKKVWGAQEFIVSVPLFLPIAVNEFYAPRTIDLDCPGDCGKETTWVIFHQPSLLRGKDNETNQIPDEAIYSVAYRCSRCSKATLTVVYRETEHKQYDSVPEGSLAFTPLGRSPVKHTKNVLVGMIKIGQYPAPTVSIPKGLQKALGKDAAALYRKALISRNNGYGLAQLVTSVELSRTKPMS